MSSQVYHTKACREFENFTTKFLSRARLKIFAKRRPGILGWNFCRFQCPRTCIFCVCLTKHDGFYDGTIVLKPEIEIDHFLCLLTI